METLQQVFQYILHIDTYLMSFVSSYGVWTYALLFGIIFCETGIVIVPLLPGDSLLFAAGSIAAHETQPLSVQLLFLSLTVASILGNKLNYFIGRLVGPQVFNQNILFLNKKNLGNTHRFYEKHGGKTIILARFIPIIRTFAPFVAGISEMNLAHFSFYNLISAVIWIGSLLAAGYYFGSLPFVQNHFSLVIYSIIGLTLVPPVCAFFYRKFQKPEKNFSEL